MARPLSMDLRRRIVSAVEGGLSRRATAHRFSISESCAVKLIQLWRRTGSVEPGTMGGHKPFALDGHERLVRELVAARPDQTLDELHEQLADRGIVVGRTSVHRYLEALGLTLKKRHSMPASRTVRMSPPRARLGTKLNRA
jgi:transposase